MGGVLGDTIKSWEGTLSVLEARNRTDEGNLALQHMVMIFFFAWCIWHNVFLISIWDLVVLVIFFCICTDYLHLLHSIWTARVEWLGLSSISILFSIIHQDNFQEECRWIVPGKSSRVFLSARIFFQVRLALRQQLK